MSTIIRFGIDLAKNSFAVSGVDEHGNIAFRKTLSRAKLLESFANRPRALVAMEAGSGAHHWARELRALGHDARIIDPRLVAPYRHQGRTGKNDLNDADAICEAAGRPRMRFVPVKTKQQQAILLVHRLRHACVPDHTRLINRMRGFLAEFGVVAPKGAATFKTQWTLIRQRHDLELPPLAWHVLDELYAELGRLHQKLLAYDRQTNTFVRDDPRAKRLTQVHGIGPITASAIVATIGNGRDFRNGRQFAAWVGLTPKTKHHRREAQARPHLQARRRLPQNPPRPRRSQRIEAHLSARRSQEPLGRIAQTHQELEQNRRRARQQACTHRLGAAREGVDPQLLNFPSNCSLLM